MLNKANRHSQFQSFYWNKVGHVARRAPDHPVVQMIVQSKLSAINAISPIEGNVLEIGCGNGHFSHWLSKIAHIVAVDFSFQMLKTNPTPKRVVMDANRLGFLDNSFDIVMSSQLLHHVDDPSRVIGQMKRIARKHIVIIEPNRNNPLMLLLALIKKSERKAIRFTKSYLKRIAEQNGLKDICIFSHGSFPPNKTPVCMMPILKYMECRHPAGQDIVLIAKKD